MKLTPRESHFADIAKSVEDVLKLSCKVQQQQQQQKQGRFSLLYQSLLRQGAHQRHQQWQRGTAKKKYTSQEGLTCQCRCPGTMAGCLREKRAQ